ncbi:MAG: lysophospholipid acyltransferase family protein [Pseudomonadales bacterium]|nr:lysophospholipid acyltransferase family protein [Pseudomonadales bacterium]
MEATDRTPRAEEADAAEARIRRVGVAHSFVGDLSDRGPSRARPSRARMTLSALGLALWCVVMPLVYFASRLLGASAASPVHRVFHRGVARLFGLRLHAIGTPRRDGGTIWVANHATYLDVFVLGSLLDASFVAKAEVAAWPVLGKLAKLQDTFFFERDPRRSREQIERLRQHLQAGRNLILFPEGTSTDGVRVQPFRSTLLEAAVGAEGVAVQPVSIAYTRYDGATMAPAERDYYAWYLPMTFLPHFLHGMGLKRADVEVRFRPALAGPDIGDRKSLARRLEEEVRAGLVASLGDEVVQSVGAAP